MVSPKGVPVEPVLLAVYLGAPHQGTKHQRGCHRKRESEEDGRQYLMSFHALSIMAVTVGCPAGGIWGHLSPRAHLLEVTWRCCELGLEPFSIQLQQRVLCGGPGFSSWGRHREGSVPRILASSPYPVRGSGEPWTLSQLHLVLGLLDKIKDVQLNLDLR